jgi:hypothetical protein
VHFYIGLNYNAILPSYLILNDLNCPCKKETEPCDELEEDLYTLNLFYIMLLAFFDDSHLRH